MEKIQISKRKDTLQSLHLLQHCQANKTRCLRCAYARLQVRSNKDIPGEYASPAIIDEFVKELEINIVCTATGQAGLKLGQVNYCELYEVCEQ
ncbi:hypothetical protein ATI02_4729 [Pseudomonas baetica]|uniref:Uncharacterized protein n=1 Tax=Pseudomonas baetica TaxID=674054 RepID=A0ABX4Q4R0_9PSED|nr:hypothetical protein ATI02_4729 [Pseudomonas baetica]